MYPSAMLDNFFERDKIVFELEGFGKIQLEKYRNY